MLVGKDIMVFGANGLIGKAVAHHIAELGGHVIGVDVNSDNDSIICDITRESDIQQLLNTTPKLDGIVNCAYPRNDQYGTDALDVSLDSFNDNVSLQLGSSFAVMKQAARYFQEHQRSLSVVMLSSIYGISPPDFNIYKGTSMTMPVEYAAVKSGLIHLTKYFVKYINQSDFRINCISPGGIENGQPEVFLNAYREKTLGHGMLSAKDICGGISFLLSDDARYINGTNLTIDDGFTL